MRIILKPGGIVTLLLGISLLTGITVYTRISTANEAKKAEKAEIASSRSVDTSSFKNLPIEKVTDTKKYRLINRSTKLALDIWEKSTFEGAWTSPQTPGASPTQQWHIRKNKVDNSVTIINSNGNNALQSVSSKAGDNISQGTLANPSSANQRWVLQSEGDYYYLYNQGSHLVLSLGTSPGTTVQWGVQQKKIDGDLMQQWQLVAAE